MNYNEFENKLGYFFKNNNLLVQALTHPSSYSGKSNLLDYERLEFLGDAVLGLVITLFLIDTYPLENEGDLAKRRAVLVSGKTLASIAKTINLGQYIIMSRGEDNVGGRKNDNNLENSMEALLGAVFVDGGLEEVKKIITSFWKEIISNMKIVPVNHKTKLQEISQGQKKGIPVYEVVSVEGQAHQPMFEIKVSIDKKLSACAKGSSKKIAENLAAEKLLNIIERENNDSKS